MIPKITLQYNEYNTYHEYYNFYEKWCTLKVSFLSWDYRQTLVVRKKQWNKGFVGTVAFHHSFYFWDDYFDYPETMIPILKNISTCYRCRESYPESLFVWDPKWGKVCKRCNKVIHWGQTILNELGNEFDKKEA